MVFVASLKEMDRNVIVLVDCGLENAECDQLPSLGQEEGLPAPGLTAHVSGH